MFDKTHFSSRGVTRGFKIRLEQLAEAVRSCAKEVTRRGLSAQDMAPLVDVAEGLAPSLPPLDPLVSRMPSSVDGCTQQCIINDCQLGI